VAEIALGRCHTLSPPRNSSLNFAVFQRAELVPLHSHLVPRHTLPVELASLERGSTELAISQLPGSSVFKTKLHMKGIQSASGWKR